MVFVYDGANEHGIDLNYPLAFRYVGTAFDFAKPHIGDDMLLENGAKMVCYRVKSRKNQFNNRLSNIGSMHAMTSERESAIFSFCQPVLHSKEIKQ